MKLTNQQLGAIIDTLEKSHELSHKKKLEESDKQNELDAVEKAKKLMKIYQKLPKELIDAIKGLYSGQQLTESKLTEKIKKRSVIPKFERKEILNKVLIASIDCKSIDELQRKLNLKF